MDTTLPPSYSKPMIAGVGCDNVTLVWLLRSKTIRDRFNAGIARFDAGLPLKCFPPSSSRDAGWHYAASLPIE